MIAGKFQIAFNPTQEMRSLAECGKSLMHQRKEIVISNKFYMPCRAIITTIKYNKDIILGDRSGRGC